MLPEPSQAGTEALDKVTNAECHSAGPALVPLKVSSSPPATIAASVQPEPLQPANVAAAVTTPGNACAVPTPARVHPRIVAIVATSNLFMTSSLVSQLPPVPTYDVAPLQRLVPPPFATAMRAGTRRTRTTRWKASKPARGSLGDHRCCADHSVCRILRDKC